MFFDKMGAICLDFKWLGSQISDPIRNPNHLQPNFLSFYHSKSWLVQISQLRSMLKTFLIFSSLLKNMNEWIYFNLAKSQQLLL